MAFTTLNLGLSLTLPANGTRNWGTTLKSTTWTKISQHRHTGAGDGNQIPTAGIEDNAVTTAKLAKNIGGTQAASSTPAGSTQTLDFNTGVIQPLSLATASGDVTLTLNNGSTGSWYYIWVTQGATPRDLIWPASVKWPQGQKPILSQANGSVDLVALYFDGSVYRGLWELNFS